MKTTRPLSARRKPRRNRNRRKVKQSPFIAGHEKVSDDSLAVTLALAFVRTAKRNLEFAEECLLKIPTPFVDKNAVRPWPPDVT